MRPTIEYIQRRFDQYNTLMFGGKLPRIPICLSEAKTYLGQCRSRITTLSDGRKLHSDFELRISTLTDLPQATVDDTVIHEMIHYFIHYNGLQDTSAHGPIFRAIMHSINTTYGRNLTITHKSTPEQQRDAIDSRPKWHIVAVIYFRDTTDNESKTIGVKVLPRITDRVIMFHHQMSKSSRVKRVDLYLHNDPYFNRYPTSSALRYHPAPLSDILPHLTTARQLSISSGSLTYAR